MNRKLNVKLLVGLLATLVLLTGGTYLAHGYQVKRQTSTLLRQADRAEEQGDLDTAASCLNRYLGYVPSDTDALARHAQLVEKRAQTPRERLRAFLLLEQVVRRDPKRNAVRRQIVPLAMGLGRNSEAMEHLQVLLRTTPDDGQLEYLAGRCEVAASNHDRAVPWLEKAIQHAPDQLDGYIQLAALLRRHLGQPERADEVMNALVKANDKSFRAYLARASYRREFGSAKDADRDLARAVELAPDEPEVLLGAARMAQANGELGRARRQLERGIDLYPKRAPFYTLLAAVEVQDDKPAEALACLRRGLEALPNQSDLLLLLADLLIQRGELTEARQVATRLRDLGQSPVWLEYLNARLMIHNGEWGKAAQAFAKVRAAFTTAFPELGGQINLLLAGCREQLGDPDGRLDALRQAVVADPLSIPPRLALTEGLLAAGRLDEALENARRLTSFRNAPPASWVLLARVLMAHNQRLPAGKGNWKEVKDALDRAAAVLPKSAEVPVLRAEALLAENPALVNRVRKMLETAQAEQPGQVEPWIALAGLDEYEGNRDAARRRLEEVRQKVGDRLELRLALARHWARHGGDGARQALGELEKDLGRFPEADQLRLLRELANAQHRAGAAEDAWRLWEQVAQKQPHDLRTHLELFDLAFETGKDAELQRLVGVIRRLEGEDGALWRCGEACRLIVLARKHRTKEGLAIAQRLLTEAAARRPSWPRVPILEADVALLQGKTDQAIDHYKRALELGERGPDVLRPLVQLLYDRQRYGEAEEVLERLQGEAAVQAGVGKLAAELALRTDKKARAVGLARQAVGESKDYRDHLWLGQMLWAAGEPKQAETALRRALQLADTVPDPWVALVEHLARTDRKADAEAKAHEAQRKLPAGPTTRLALARCYHAAGRRDLAEEQYRAALRDRPDDVAALRNLAGFYMGGNELNKAEPHLRKLLDPATKTPGEVAAWARRHLALVLASAGDYRQFQQALALLEENLRGSGPRGEDWRAKAALLVTRPGHRGEALRALEEAGRRQPLSPDEQFLLAQLYETTGDGRTARQRMERLLGSPQGDKPQYLAAHVASLLKQGDAAARTWLARLEKLEPQTWQTIRLSARVLHAEGKGPQAVPLVKKYAQRSDAQVEQAAALLEELGQTADAEELYRKHSAKPPTNALGYAQFLARQQRVAEALDVCEAARKTCSAEDVALASVAVLRAGRAGDAPSQRVEPWLKAAADKGPQSLALQFAWADYLDFRGRPAEAQAIYRRLLERDGRHLLALNNTAWYLAVKDGKGAEALDLIDRAVASGGRLPYLLETRADIYLATGEGRKALDDLRNVIAEEPTATRYFHLARAYRTADNPSAAGDALKKAHSLGLTADSLHPLHRKAYQQLVAELGKK